MIIQRVLSFHYGLMIIVSIFVVSTLGNPRPNYFDRNENPELSQWAEQHQDQVHEMANRLRNEYNRAITHYSGQNVPGGTTSCKTTCIPSTTWVSNTGKTQEEISQIAKELTLKLVNDLNSGKIVYNQITEPNWFENYAAHELHLLQNQHNQNNFGAQIHMPQGTYYHKTEKKQVYEYSQAGGNIQPTYIYKPTITSYDEKKQESREHSSSGYPTLYYGHGKTVEKTETTQEEHKDIQTIAHVPVYTDSYFHASDLKSHKLNRQPTAAPAIHVSYSNHEDNAFAKNEHNPTTAPVTVTHKEQHVATVEKQTMPIIYKYGNNERKTEQTHHRNRTAKYRRPSTNTGTNSRKNVTTTYFEKSTRRPTHYSGTKHSIYKHLNTDDGIPPNYKPRVVHKESKVRDYHGFGGGSVASENVESQNQTSSLTSQQTSGHAQINYRPAYVGHQSRYNRTHGFNYTRPGYIIPGGNSQTRHTYKSTQTSHHGRPEYGVIGGGQTSQTSQSAETSQHTSQPGYIAAGGDSQIVQSSHSSEQSQRTRPGYVLVGGGGNSLAVESSENIIETVQHRKPGYVITSGGSQNSDSTHSTQTKQYTRPGYVLIGGGQQTTGTSHSSHSSQQTTQPGYIITGGDAGGTIFQTSYSNRTTQEARPGYIVQPGAHSNQISQNSQNSEHIVRPGYVITGGGGLKTVETSHSSQTSQGRRPGYVVVTGGGSQTVESSETSQTSQQSTRPGYVIAGGRGSHTFETTHSSQTSQQGGRPGYVVTTGGGRSQTLESHKNETSQGSLPGYIITGGDASQTLESSHSSQKSQGSRPGYIITGGGGSHTVESSQATQTTQQDMRPGYIIAGGGGSQTVEITNSSQTSQQGGHPGYVVITGGEGSKTVESSHTSQTSQRKRPGYVITGSGGSQTIESFNYNQSSQQGGRPRFLVVGGSGTSQTLESYTNQTSEQGTRQGHVITGNGRQTIETTHSSETSQQSGRPGFVVVSGGTETVETSHTSETSQEIIQPEFIITGVGSSQIVENIHSSETIQEGGSGYVVIAGGGQSQSVGSSHTNQSSQQGSRPGFLITGGGGQTFETTYFNQSSQQSGRPGYVSITGGEQSQTVKSAHTSQIIQQGSRPGFVITNGSGQTIETSHINQTSEHSRPGYIITGGAGSELEESIHSIQTSQHNHPGYIVTSGGSQSVEITHANQSSQQTTRPGFAVLGSGSQSIKSTQTNEASQHSQPGYVVIGSGGQTSEISQTNQTSEQTSRPGYIITDGGSQTVESIHSSHTSEQSSKPGFVITGGDGSQSNQVSHSSNSESKTHPGFVVVGGGEQSSQTSHTNQTLEESARPGYIITGGGSQAIETSQTTSQNSQDNRPGYVVVEGVSQTSHTSLSNHSSVHGNSGIVIIGGGGSQNYSQELISQLNQTGGGVYLANGSYISGLGFQEIHTNWTSATSDKNPYVIISKDRGDQPPHHFEDYFDSEEILEKEPGIGFYPIGVKPEIGLLVTGRPRTANQHGQWSHSESSHNNHKNHQTHAYPGSAVTTIHKHHKHTIGTLPGDSRPLLEHHHVSKQLVDEGSLYNIHRSQSDIIDNELRESYGFNKSNEHRHNGMRHGHQQQHSTQHDNGSHQHGHRHHHGDMQIGKKEFFFVTRNGRRQNVSRHEHEEMLKSQVKILIENFARTVERDIQNIDPEEDQESVQVEIVYDNMEKLLLQINSVVGDDPDTKKMIEKLIEKDLEAYQKKYRVKRSFLNLGFGSQKTQATASSKTAKTNAVVDAELANGLFHTTILPGTGQYPSPSFSANLNTDSYSAENSYNPYEVTHNTLDTQSSYDLTQQTQNEDFSQVSLEFTNQLPKSASSNKPNLDLTQHLADGFSTFLSKNEPGSTNIFNGTEDADHTLDTQRSYYLTQSTRNENLSQFSFEFTNVYSGTEDDGQETLNEDLTQLLDNNQHSQSVDKQEHISFALPPGSSAHPTNINSFTEAHGDTLGTQSSYGPTQETQDKLSQFSLGFTNQSALATSTYQPNEVSIQQHLANELSMLHPKHEAGRSNINSGMEGGGQTLDTQSLYDLTEQTQNEDLSPFPIGFTNTYSGTEDDGQTLIEDLSEFLGNNQNSQNFDKQEHINFEYMTHPTNNINSYQSFLSKHPTSPLIEQEGVAEDITVAGTCCWQPGSPNYQPIGLLADNININGPPVAEKNNFRPINPIYQPIDQFIVISTPPQAPSEQYNHRPFQQKLDSKSKPIVQLWIPTTTERSPRVCCWQPGSPNYQPIGSKTIITDIIVGPVNQQPDVTNGEAFEPVRHFENSSTRPCQTKQLTSINPTYKPINILTQTIGGNRPIEARKPTNFVDLVPGTSSQTSHSAFDSQRKPTEDSNGQAVVGTEDISPKLVDKPEIPKDTLSPIRPDEQPTVYLQESSYPVNDGVAIYNGYSTPKQLTGNTSLIDPSKFGDIRTNKSSIYPGFTIYDSYLSPLPKRTIIDGISQSEGTPSKPHLPEPTFKPTELDGQVPISGQQRNGTGYFTPKQYTVEPISQHEVVQHKHIARPANPHSKIHPVYLSGSHSIEKSTDNTNTRNQKSETLSHGSFEDLQTTNNTQINQYSYQETQQQSIVSSGSTYNYPSYLIQYSGVNVPYRNINYISEQPDPLATNPQTNIQAQESIISPEKSQHPGTNQDSSNTTIFQTSEHSQTRGQVQENQFLIQSHQDNNQTVQQNTQHTGQPLDSLSEQHPYNVEQRKQANTEQTEQKKTEQFNEKSVTSTSGSTNTIQKHSETNTTNTQQISTQTPKPVEHQHNRGDQTSLDNEDYSDISYKTDKNDKSVQNTMSLDDYFQYPDQNSELPQLTQKITEEDYTNLKKPPQRFKRQLPPISLLDYVTKQSNYSNTNSLVSDEADGSVKQSPEDN